MCSVMPYRGYSSKIPAGEQTRVETPVDMQVDFSTLHMCSPSPIKTAACDPMLTEAGLRMPWKPIDVPEVCMHSIDKLPRRRPSSCGRTGIMGSALDHKFAKWVGVAKPLALGSPDGPNAMCGLGLGRFASEQVDRALALEVDLCLSGLEDEESRPCSLLPLEDSVDLSTSRVLVAVPGAQSAEPAEESRDVQLLTDEFISIYKKPLQAPILLLPPHLRKT